ncbi:site-specific DNA-methyltransferase [Candidatus Collierbacteria bacterium]|nr:site-specific DNA-methyltransferase [Candidatus Collierbacteria bacterium]
MKSNKKQKLELTWIGKDEELKLEPRILIEDPNKSYGEPNSQNMLIHGDNLLALKALEQDFTNRIKCIYIDPPYNIGAAGVPYDDFIEHSLWLSLMKPRLEIIYKLLADDGLLAVQIDDNEFAKLFILISEVFSGERNLKTIVVKMSEATGVKMASTKKAGSIPKLKEYIILAKKGGIKGLRLENIPKEKWDDEYKIFIDNVSFEEIEDLKNIIIDENRTDEDINKADETCNKFICRSLKEVYTGNNLLQWKYDNAWRIARSVATTDSAKQIADTKKLSTDKTNFIIVTPKKKAYLIKADYSDNAKQPRIKLLFADQYLTVAIGDLWTDIKTTGLEAEGGVDFKKSKKPEALIKRIIKMSTNEGDFVLDSFLGSGTTSAVAHKISRRWIGIELGNHANTHCIPRLKSVVDGTDQSGISKLVDWQGGGGFKFYNLAPSLLRKDSFGNFVIDEQYNANMLAAAMCKHEGFKYSPDEAVYWKQGKSTETDYIFVTTGFVTVEQLDAIHAQMTENESLLICAKSFAPESGSHFSNITIKKIPQMILGKCEFGKDNYDLNIIKATKAEAEESEEGQDEQ